MPPAPPKKPPRPAFGKVPNPAARDEVPGYVPAAYKSWVSTAAKRTGLPASVVAAQINDESGFNPHAVSPTGAEGIAQFEPGTWKTWGKGSPFDPAASLNAYSGFMRQLLKQEHGSVRNALAAYNAGPGNIPAGLGYADHILSAAGQGGGIVDKIGKDVGGVFGGVASTASSVAGIADTVGKFGTAIDWFLVPSHWVRIFAGIGGGLMVLTGVWSMTHVGGRVQASVPLAGALDVPAPASLPLGILLTGSGAVLLFVAFHNLPDNVTDLPSLLSHLSEELHSEGKAAA
jgi:hypothetical protein